MSVELPNYKDTKKCTENGKTCNGNHLKITNDGRKFLACTDCGHFSEQLMADKKTCEHPAWKEFTVRKEGPNQGKAFKKCTHCDQFEWADGGGAKKRKTDSQPTGATMPLDNELEDRIKRIETAQNALYTQLLMAQQLAAKNEQRIKELAGQQ